METFEVGQTVKHRARGDVEVTYGPFIGIFGDGRYLVRQEDGREVMVSPARLSAIPEPPKFAVGDVVKLRTRGGARATVEYGPFDDGDVFVVKLVDATSDPARTFTASASVMEAEPEPIRVGDRVRVLDDDGGGRHRFNGKIGTVKEVNGTHVDLPFLVQFGDGRGSHGDLNGRWHCGAVERVADGDVYVHDGVTYDLTAKYRDSDGDVWRFARFGDTVRAAAYGEDPAEYSQLADGVLSRWAPFTRV